MLRGMGRGQHRDASLRLRLLGDGAAEADRRRARAVQLEAAAFQERRAQGVAFIQGRNVRRLGFGRPDPE